MWRCLNCRVRFAESTRASDKPPPCPQCGGLRLVTVDNWDREGRQVNVWEEVRPEHVGKPFVSFFGRTWLTASFAGRIFPDDIGRRVYLVPADDPEAAPILQMESREQRRERERGLA